MDEWPLILKIALGVFLFLMLLSVVILIVNVSNTAGWSQMRKISDAAEFEDYSGYDEREVDRAIGKNIARSNFDRVRVYLAGHPSDPQIDRDLNVGSKDWGNIVDAHGKVVLSVFLPENPSLAHDIINKFFNFEPLSGKQPNFIVTSGKDTNYLDFIAIKRNYP